jgi:hypothetical protein
MATPLTIDVGRMNAFDKYLLVKTIDPYNL